MMHHYSEPSLFETTLCSPPVARPFLWWHFRHFWAVKQTTKGMKNVQNESTLILSPVSGIWMDKGIANKRKTHAMGMFNLPTYPNKT